MSLRIQDSEPAPASGAAPVAPKAVPWPERLAAWFLWAVLVVASLGTAGGVLRLAADMRTVHPEKPEVTNSRLSAIGSWFLTGGAAGVGLVLLSRRRP